MIYIWIWIVSFMGSFIQGATGFGYAIVCMSLWPFLLPFKVASIMEVISAFVMTIGITIKLRHHINVKLMLIPFCSSMVGSTLGVHLLFQQEDMMLRSILGFALIVLSLYFIFYSDRIRIRPTTTNSIIFGFISGLCGGLFNIGGPAMVIYYLAASKDKMEYNGTLQANFALVTAYTFFMHLFYGNVTLPVLKYSFISILAVCVGSWLGLRFFYKIPQKQLKKVIYLFMIVMGMILIVKG